MDNTLAQAIIDESKRRGADPLDFATLVGFETGGTFDIWQKGPVTKWGQHRGLIQMGEPQRKQFNYHDGLTPEEAVKSSFDYLEGSGWKPGMSLLDMYSTINAGAPGRYDAVDNGTTVRQKVESANMQAQRSKAARLLNMEFTPIATADPYSNDAALKAPNEIPQYAAYTPPPPIDQGPSVLDTLAAGFNTESTIPGIYRSVFGPAGPKPDPNWTLDDTRLQQEAKDRGFEVSDYVDAYTPHSEEHFQQTLGEMQRHAENERTLAQAGGLGTFSSIANSILDVPQLGADLVASATVGPEVAFIRRAGRFGEILHGAVTGAAGGFAGAELAAQYNPHRDQMDALAGTVFGGAGGALVGTLTSKAATALEGDQVAGIIRSNVAPRSVDVAPGSAGAARNLNAETFVNDEALEVIGHEDFKNPAFHRVRADLSSQLQTSKGSTTTKLLSGLVLDSVGRADKSVVNQIATTEIKSQLYDEFSRSAAITTKPQFAQFFQDGVKAGTYGRFDKDEAFNDFGSKITRYIEDRRPDRANYYEESVRKTGDKLSEGYQEMAKMLSNPGFREGQTYRGAKGAEFLQPDKHFVPHVWDDQRLVNARETFANGVVDEAVANGIRKASPFLEEAAVQRMSKAFVKAIMNRAHGLEDLSRRSISMEDMTSLLDILKKDGGLAEDDAKSLLKGFTKTDDAGRDASLKHRLFMDMQHARVENPMLRNGTRSDKALEVYDLMETNALHNYDRYMRRNTGRVALSKYVVRDPRSGDIVINGITSDGEWDKLLQRVREQWADHKGSTKDAEAGAERDIRNLNIAYNSIMGRPIADQSGNFNWFLRQLGGYNFTRLLGQVGFAQVAEYGKPIASLGFKATMQHIPAFRRMVTADGETILRDNLANEVEGIFGLGTDRLRDMHDSRYELYGDFFDKPTLGTKGKVEKFMKKANKVTAEGSGLTQSTIMQERWVGNAIVQKFSDMAAGAKGLSAERLADLGLSEDMTKRIGEQFTKHVERVPGIGKKVAKVNFDAWDDREAATMFRLAGRRLAHNLVQRNDIGALIPFMRYPIARALMQFRSFMVGAYVKDTLKSIHFRDATAAKTLAFTMGLAGLSYVMQSKVQSIGRSDKDEFLAKRLAPGAVTAAAFARTGTSSVLPMLIDTARYAARKDPWFSATRTTGQASDILLGNPTTGGLNDLMQASAAFAGLFEDREWSQDEARSMARVMMFGNFVPVTAAINAMISDMPAHAPRPTKN